ncbi:MAG: thrombospondin type 3 repeat-containing protein [Ectothiorhodospiraceae bacterium]|nr:thrombospondin type 3 repeat-containing protein [Ectothiorhodospiraceae bacterium]
MARDLSVVLGSTPTEGGLDFRILLTEVQPGADFHPGAVLVEGPVQNLPQSFEPGGRSYALGLGCLPLTPGRTYAWVLDAFEGSLTDFASASTGLNLLDPYAAGRAFSLPGPFSAASTRESHFASQWMEQLGVDWSFELTFADVCFAASEYFPLAPGNRWTYRVNGASEVTDVVGAAPVEIEGVPTLAIARSDGSTVYYTNDSAGVRLHGERVVDLDLGDGVTRTLVGTYIPPMVVGRSGATPGDEVASSGIIEATVSGIGTLVFDYTAHTIVGAATTTTVPAGTFDTVRSTTVVTSSVDLLGQTLRLESTQTMDLARHLGPVRISEQLEGEAADVWELTALAIDTDGDGVDVLVDNCPTVANADQADRDRDGIGNACDRVSDIATILPAILDLLE